MTEDRVFQELRRISKILTLVNANTIELEISKIATTDARKKMWALIDGQRTSKDIADELKVTQRGVRYFLNDMKVAGFIEYVDNDAPRKTFEYVPPSWIELLKDKESAEGAQTEGSGSTDNKILEEESKDA